ncbi:tumor necrosis factor receptor superfamily member 17 [Hoplias malabaricus]|uniref:tumor necrosis factor receptor superfamily member 17 n=1 Tax=Hoplias malabaricus TaxID=27720 RepID=UPI003462F5A6
MIPVESKCAKNYYYDGLLENCQHCSIRCNSPPTICNKYCKITSTLHIDAGEDQNVQTILIVLFVFLGACTTLTAILRVIRRKTCKHHILVKAQEQVPSESERDSDTSEQYEDVDKSAAASETADVEEGMTLTHYNSHLPLPSTEEGATMLVTTKTVQTYNCSTHCTQGVTLGLWRSG